MKTDSYTAKGTKQSSKVALPARLEAEQNMDLLAQAIHVYRDRGHTGSSKTQTRGEVSLTTKKWYRQKGTGRARHGAQSAPIFVGGGKAHGPKGVKRTLVLPKKLRQKALAIAVSMKVDAGQLVVVDGISAWKKTKQAQAFLDALVKSRKLEGKTRATFALSEKNKTVARALRNLSNVEVIAFKDLNAYSVYYGGVLVIDKQALAKKEDSAKQNKKK